jgi:hypothetical protein
MRDRSPDVRETFEDYLDEVEMSPGLKTLLLDV